MIDIGNGSYQYRHTNMTKRPTETPADIDAFLAEVLEADLIEILLQPPRVPSFARETIRPRRSS